MASKSYILDYTKCKVNELRKFVLARDVFNKDTALRTCEMKRDALINRLRELDNSATFHGFTSLPPELRNDIYTDLLTCSSLTWAHTSITRVSKQIHAESNPILYGINLFEIRASGREVDVFVGGWSHGCFADATVLGEGLAYETVLAMRKAHHLKLSLRLSTRSPEKRYDRAQAIASAVSLLTTNTTALKTVIVEIEDDHIDSDYARLHRALLPLSALPKHTRVTATSRYASIARSVMYWKRARPVFNVEDFRAMRRVLRQAQATVARLRSAAGGLGAQHSRVIEERIKQLLYDGCSPDGVDMSEIKSHCQKLEVAVEAAKRFEESLKQTLSLQPGE